MTAVAHTDCRSSTKTAPLSSNLERVRHSKVFEVVHDAIPPASGMPGRSRRRPDNVHANKGYGYAHCRESLKRRSITARIAPRGIESSEKFGRHCWVVERTHAWLAGFGKLRIRFERAPDTRLALLPLACAVICSRCLDRFC